MRPDEMVGERGARPKSVSREAGIAAAFLAESRRVLLEDHFPRIERCIELLSEDEIWSRPSAESNSVGNLLLHLAGNLRQYVVSGVGGDPDTRDRQAEFSEQGPLPPGEAMERLRSAVLDAAAVLEGADPAALLERRTVQGQDVTGLYAIYHAVEHFSMHTGQIIFATKMKKGDLGFYEVTNGVPLRRW